MKVLDFVQLGGLITHFWPQDKALWLTGLAAKLGVDMKDVAAVGDSSGAISRELGGLTNLERLYLHGNELSGTIPREFVGLTALTNLWLKNNNLSGQIPSELGDLSNLQRVRISGNNFTGCIPAGLTDDEDIGRTSDAEDLGLPVCTDS